MDIKSVFAHWLVTFQAISPRRLTGLYVHGCPDLRTSKGSLESSGWVMEEAPVSGGAHKELPQVPMGELGPAGRCPLQWGWLFSSPNSSCHRWVFERVLRLLWWFDTNPGPLFQSEGPPSDETQLWKRSLITTVTSMLVPLTSRTHTHMHCPPVRGPLDGGG